MSDSPRQLQQQERTDSGSYSNSSSNRTPSATLRLVPSEPPRLLGQGTDSDDVFGRTPLPTHPSHILSPGRGRDRDAGTALQLGFQPPTRVHPSTASAGLSISSMHSAPQPPHNVEPATTSPNPKPKYTPKKRLQLHKDKKTFSLVPQDEAQSPDELPQSPPPPTLSRKSSTDFYFAERSNAQDRANSLNSCIQLPSPTTGSAYPLTPVSATKLSPVDHITNPSWVVGGIRKVPETPESKEKSALTSAPPVPEPRTSDASTQPSHDLSTKPSFQSNVTGTTTSENTNYKVYHNTSASTSEAALDEPPSSSDSNYQLLGSPSPPISESSVVYRPRTAISEAISESENENENYEVHGDPSPSASSVNLIQKYSQESLIVPPLLARRQRSNEQLGYYKQRSREKLRTGSFTSISTVLSQQDAFRGSVGGDYKNHPPIPPKQGDAGPWADSLTVFPLRSPMNETPHQWSSQLSTVQSVSDEGSDRDSRAWSDGRLSSGFPSTGSRHSRQLLSITSSMALASEEDLPLSPPQPSFARRQRHSSSSSVPVIEDRDEYGDGITDMQDSRLRHQRSRLFSLTPSDNDRTSTMRSTASSRANSLLASSIPTWAKLYYGSGERKYLNHLNAPGSSTEGSLSSRANSFRSGSPNTDHLPLSIYSPRRRPREINTPGPYTGRGSLEISPAPHLGSDGQLINDPFSRKFRTWSMSSMWSPHLRPDRRATRHSVWEPPSVNWSTDGSWFGRRNVQVVMFVTGFIFPFGKPNPRNFKSASE
jgi:hypothetical protein